MGAANVACFKARSRAPIARSGLETAETLETTMSKKPAATRRNPRILSWSSGITPWQKPGRLVLLRPIKRRGVR
jgi:hypothetical protein